MIRSPSRTTSARSRSGCRRRSPGPKPYSSMHRAGCFGTKLYPFVSAVWRNPASGKSVIERDHVHNVFYEDGTVAIMGLNFHLSLPHGRTVLIDAGKLRFDTDGYISFEAGNHQVADGAYSGLGSALA